MTLVKGSTVLQSSGTQGVIQVMYCTQLMIESKIKRNCNRTQKRLVEPRHVFRQHLFNLHYSKILGQLTQQVYSWQKFELFQLNLSVDEVMTAFQGRLSMKEKKQYVPSKPIKTGTKVWEALVLRMVTYALHKFPKRQDGGVTGHGFGYRVLRELSQVAVFSVTILLHLSNLFVIY